MDKKLVLALGTAGLFILAGTGKVFSQENMTQENVPAAASAAAPEMKQEAPAAPAEPQVEPDIQWVWGEVVSVDPVGKAITVKYLDYESDQEKEIKLAASDKTTFENVQSIADIKEKSTVSVDYVALAEGKNVAKNISLEKAESSAVKGVDNETVSPEAASPAGTTEQ